MRLPAMRLLALCQLVVAAACALNITAAAAGEPVLDKSSLFERATQRLSTTWNEGQTELYLPLHAHHFRSAYSRERINGFNENALGIGIGRGSYDRDGDWHGLYAMGFRDSHFQPQYMAGYGYKTYWNPGSDFKVGLGYTLFLTTRADIGHYTPIPGLLPIASLEYRKVALDATYVPGSKGVGNILFFWGKYHF